MIAPILKQLTVSFFNTPSVGSSVPAIDDRNVYCAAGMSEDGQSKGVILAFNKENMRQVWRTELESGIGDSALQIYDGHIYVCNNNGPICINCNDGSLVWEQKLKIEHKNHSYQEIFLSVAHDGVFVGSPDGKLRCLNSQNGNIKWENDTQKVSKFYGKPLLFNNNVYFVSETGDFFSVERHTGNVNFNLQLEHDGRSLGGCFSGPMIAFNEIACLTSSGSIALVTFDGKIKHWDKGYSRFLSSSNYVNTRMLVADADGTVAWLSEDLSVVHKCQIEGRFLFGTPQVIGNKVVVTTYGDEYYDHRGNPVPKFSYLHILERGDILETYRIPVNLHALPMVRIDSDGTVFAQLTGFLGNTSYEKHCGIARIELESLKTVAAEIERKRLEAVALEAALAAAEAEAQAIASATDEAKTPFVETTYPASGPRSKPRYARQKPDAKKTRRTKKLLPTYKKKARSRGPLKSTQAAVRATVTRHKYAQKKGSGAASSSGKLRKFKITRSKSVKKAVKHTPQL